MMRYAVLVALLTGCSGASTGGSSTPDSGDDSSECNDLADAAATQLNAVVQQNLACDTDDDCTWNGPGSCGDLCGALSNKAGATTVQNAAVQACQPFEARGCVSPVIECIAPAPLICSGGTCVTYSLGVSPALGTLTHGVCQSFGLSYVANGGLPDAPHDITAAVGPVVDGSLYADPTCTASLTTGTLTIPAGSASLAFGFMPTSPGTCGFNLSLTTAYSYTAQ